MMFLRILFGLICIAGGYSCNTHSGGLLSSGSLTVLAIDEERTDLAVEDLFDSLRFVQLETTPEALFDYARQLQILNDKFYLLDRNGTIMLSFDKNGKFLKKLDMQGRGPNEYLMLQWLSADPVSNKIIAADGGLKKILIYDEDLNLERVVKVDFIPYSVVAYRNDLILHYASEDKDIYQGKDERLQEFDLHLIDMDGNIVQALIKNRTPKETSVCMQAVTAYRDNGDILYMPALGDTVYSISMTERSASPFYVVQSGHKGVQFLNDEQLKEATRKDLEEYEQQDYFFPLEFYDTGSYITLRSGMYSRFFYNKNTGDSFRYNSEKLKGDETLRYLTQYAHLIDKDWCYVVLNAISLQASYHSFSGKYKAMIDSMDAEANSFIACYKLKEL